MAIFDRQTLVAAVDRAIVEFWISMGVRISPSVRARLLQLASEHDTKILDDIAKGRANESLIRGAIFGVLKGATDFLASQGGAPEITDDALAASIRAENCTYYPFC